MQFCNVFFLLNYENNHLVTSEKNLYGSPQPQRCNNCHFKCLQFVTILQITIHFFFSQYVLIYLEYNNIL